MTLELDKLKKAMDYIFGQAGPQPALNDLYFGLSTTNPGTVGITEPSAENGYQRVHVSNSPGQHSFSLVDEAIAADIVGEYTGGEKFGGSNGDMMYATSPVTFAEGVAYFPDGKRYRLSEPLNNAGVSISTLSIHQDVYLYSDASFTSSVASVSGNSNGARITARNEDGVLYTWDADGWVEGNSPHRQPIAGNTLRVEVTDLGFRVVAVSGNDTEVFSTTFFPLFGDLYFEAYSLGGAALRKLSVHSMQPLYVYSPSTTSDKLTEKVINTPIAFPEPSDSWGDIGWFVVFDAAEGGNVLFWGSMEPREVFPGEPLTLPEGSVAVVSTPPGVIVV